jgi:hypothetical protein
MNTTQIKSEIDYESLFNKMTIGLAVHEMIWGEDNKAKDILYLGINESYEKILGMKKGDVVGKLAYTIFPGLGRRWIEKYEKVVKTGEPIIFEDYLEQKDIYLKVYAFKNAENQFTVAFEDVTATKVAEKKLTEKMEEMEKLNKLMIGRELRMAELKNELASNGSDK